MPASLAETCRTGIGAASARSGCLTTNQIHGIVPYLATFVIFIPTLCVSLATHNNVGKSYAQTRTEIRELVFEVVLYFRYS